MKYGSVVVYTPKVQTKPALGSFSPFLPFFSLCLHFVTLFPPQSLSLLPFSFSFSLRLSPLFFFINLLIPVFSARTNHLLISTGSLFRVPVSASAPFLRPDTIKSIVPFHFLDSPDFSPWL